MEKSKQIERHWALLKCLSHNPEGLTLEQLSTKLQVSSRTVQRDIMCMKSAGVEINEDQTEPSGKKVFCFAHSDDQGSVSFSYDEAVAFYIGRQFLEPMMGSIIWSAVNSGLQKIRKVIGGRTLFFCDHLATKFFQTKVGWSNYASKRQYLDEILLGLEDYRCVKIQYRSQDAPKSEVYTIDPYHILMHRGSIYIIGYSHKSMGIRHWKLDRVEDAIALGSKFEKPADFSIGKYMDGSFGVVHFPTEKLQKVQIWFDESVARYVGEHNWSSSQKITVQPDGSIILDLQLNNTVELKSWILGFGPHAEVIKPSSLRDEILVDLESMLKKYNQNK